MNILKTVKRFVFPPKCACCRNLMSWDTSSSLCADCAEKLHTLQISGRFAPSSSICSGLYIFNYEDTALKSMIYRMKNNPTENLRMSFAQPLATAILKNDFSKSCTLITNVPRSPERVCRDGCDQAKILAVDISHITGIKYKETLTRYQTSENQKALTSSMRKQNVKGLYHATKPLNGENIILIDDVVTTGSTIEECARVLKKAGASNVFAASVAHTLLNFTK